MVKIVKSTLILSLSLFLLLGMTQISQAVSVKHFAENDPLINFQQEINNWKTNDAYKSGSVVGESFEQPDYSVDWYNEVNDTAFGDFSVEGGASAYGQGSAAAPNEDGKLRIENSAPYGRYATHGEQFLDSADNARVVLDLTEAENKFKNLFFYMTDPSDQNAYTRITGINGGSGDDTISYKQDDGGLHFIGITTETGYLSQVVWETFSNNPDPAENDEGNLVYSTTDGWGMDGMSTVPEPATLLLLGTGLIGLAGFARRRRSAKG